ncbi:MAG: hypothetical protein LBC48_07910 [Dysgonamonadaceae bacterium]|nr:hypothetical protein [Dysgonamonadaceae bacterium]
MKAAFQGIALRQATLVAYFKNYVETYEKRIGKDRTWENALFCHPVGKYTRRERALE